MRRRLALLCATGILGACSEDAVLPPVLESAQPPVVTQGTASTVLVGGRFDFTALRSDFAAGQTKIEVAGQLYINTLLVMSEPVEGCGADDCISIVVPDTLQPGFAELQLVDRYGQESTRTDLLEIRPRVGSPANVELEISQAGQPTRGGLRIGQPFTVIARVVDNMGQVVRSAPGSIGIKFIGQDLGDLLLPLENGEVRSEVSGADCSMELIKVDYDTGSQILATEQTIRPRGGDPTLEPQEIIPSIVKGACVPVTDIEIKDACGNPLSRQGDTITVSVDSLDSANDAMYFDSRCTEDAVEATGAALPLYYHPRVGGIHTGHVFVGMTEIGTLDFVVQDSRYELNWTATANSVTAGECVTLTGNVTENQMPAAAFRPTFSSSPNGLEIIGACGTNQPIVTDDSGNFTAIVRAELATGYDIIPTNTNGDVYRIQVNAGPTVRIRAQGAITAGECDSVTLVAVDQYDNSTTFPASIFPVDVTVLSDPGVFGMRGVGVSEDPGCEDFDRPLSLESGTFYMRWNRAPEVQLQFRTATIDEVLAVTVEPAPAHYVGIEGPTTLWNAECGRYDVDQRDIFGNPTNNPWSITLTPQGINPPGVSELSLYRDSNCVGGISPMLAVSSNSAVDVGLRASNAPPGRVYELSGVSGTPGVLAGSARVELIGGCGDGRLDPGETCDEGGQPSLGCVGCFTTPGYICGGQPSQCYLRTNAIEISDGCNPAGPACRNNNLGGVPLQAFIVRARPGGQLWPVANGRYQQTSGTVDMVFDPGAGLEGDVRERAIDLSGTAVLNIAGGQLTKTGPDDAIHVAGDARLSLVNFDIGPTEHHAIHVTANGRLNYVRGTVFENKDGGIVLDNTQNTLLANVLTYRNGENGGFGIEVKRPRPETRLFNVTVLDSIDCGSSGNPTTIDSSIIMPYEQLPDGCVLSNSMASFDANMMGNNNIDLMGVARNAGIDPATGRLLAHSPCIDHVDNNSPATMVPASRLDLDGDQRPRGPLNDCGADEF